MLVLIVVCLLLMGLYAIITLPNKRYDEDGMCRGIEPEEEHHSTPDWDDVYGGGRY